ncbi:MAG: 50S ribosomal protein L10 [Candidatus Woesearchaeota archaeon]
MTPTQEHRHIPEEKKRVVEELKALIKQYTLVGIVDLENLPAKQLQTMREKLRGRVLLKMAKKRLIKIALEESKKDFPHIEKLSEHLEGLSAVLFSNDNPFTLYKFLEKNKSPAPAKAGQKAPKDIVVKAGKTNFAPGPIISELGKFGIKTSVEGGKLAIKADVTVAHEGDVISPQLAQMLMRLGIEPMEMGLRVTAFYEKGDILTNDVLSVDESKYLADLALAHQYALNLGVEAVIFADATTPLLLAKAVRNARQLSIECVYPTTDTIGDLMAKAQGIAQGLAISLNV